MPHTPVERNAAELKTTGLKATLPRLKILEVFQDSSQRHLSAEEVYRALLARDADIGLATVYRVLSQFEQAGLLLRSQFDNDRAVYELNEGEHHDHLVCLHCGKVEEFHDPVIEGLQHRVAQARGFALRAHSLALYGLCDAPACQAQAESGRGALGLR
ncbi:ferric iron uptake transcriptional regulator [Ideonella livida]|uniref:Ferric uptake regulation protein n=1 Tax=Ideonella livida TaxID=2707176 RepID=A0A7C9TIU0_9BURK|nr:ferric iron uptake transcriptional regulator [Ideonella livida]NDY91579.1 ferric iron uptake transcriptional regulator [Ideonella livida]